MTHQVLVVGADAQVVVALDHAVQRFQLPRHQLEEGGLACAVGADNRDAAVQINAQVNIPGEGSRCRRGRGEDLEGERWEGEDRTQQ